MAFRKVSRVAVEPAVSSSAPRVDIVIFAASPIAVTGVSWKIVKLDSGLSGPIMSMMRSPMVSAR